METILFPIQMYDPKREYKNNKNEIDTAIQTVLDHGIFINGPEVKQLESSLANYVGIKHCIAVSNGTDALKIALLSLDIGIDDEVITVSHTWISTAEVISIINAIPVFIDIDRETFNMDISKIEEAITPKTKAIIVVSLYGQMPDYNLINKIGEKHNIPIIEDGAQSFGATFNGNKSCSMTTIGTTSFFPSKPLGCYGDGGAIFTNDDDLASKIRSIKNHGGIKRFHHKYIGLNGRLDTIQAAILNVKLNYFNETLKKRNDCAYYYSDKLQPLEDKDLIILPKIKKECYSAWAQYSILINKNYVDSVSLVADVKDVRDNIVLHLKDNKANVSIFYPKPVHEQECFQYLFKQKSLKLPNTTDICNSIFNLPCYAEITKIEQDYIISLVFRFFDLNYE